MPELGYSEIKTLDDSPPDLPDDIERQVEIQCKYEGYLKRQEAEVKKFKNLERIKLPSHIDYHSIPGLTIEIRNKLSDIRPYSLGQASRIPGMTPAAVSILMVWLKRYGRETNS